MRKTAQYTVDDEGRDKGKVFLITEMSAAQGEAWACRALLALMGSNTQLPDGFESLGMAGLAELGFKMLANLRWDIAEPLLAEMMACLKIIPDPKKLSVVRDLLETTGNGEDIEEISTRFKLKAEVFKLHTGFLKAVAPSLFEKAAAAQASKHIGTRASAK